jgi:hypothetical protein
VRNLIPASALALFLLSSTVAYADDIEMTASGITVSDDSITTTYSGDVVLHIPKGVKYEVKAKTTDALPNGGQHLKGDVQFKVTGLLITTDEAKLTHAANGDIFVNMDAADSKNLEPAK